MDTWIITEVTDMGNLFNEYMFDGINDIISGWDVSKVTNMSEMFSFCETFNQPLDSWVVSSVETMHYMFVDCESFNQPLNSWDVSKVTNMFAMFSGCKKFNQPLDRWDVSQVKNMTVMFGRCYNFNQPLNGWNVSSVETMPYMFVGCASFNQPLHSWDVSHVVRMEMMFKKCASFNQPLNNWIVSRVTNMDGMFTNCETFNQPLNNWIVSRVENMNSMFSGCTNFNQNISNWDLMPGVTILDMFQNCPIDEANKPHIPVTIAPVAVNAVQIHQSAAKINYTELNKFLRSKISQPIVIPQNYADYIRDTINTLINESYELPAKKEELNTGIKKIYDDRLKGLNYREQSQLLLNSIINSLEYVKTQPSVFKKMYVEAFVKDCVHAYEGNDGMTCAAGALERIIFSLVPACKTDPANPDYTTLIIIISGPELIKQSIKDWYILHNSTNSDNDIFHAKTKIEKQADLREYLLQRYPGLPDLIDELIINYAEVFGWEADDFTYGGGKRRNSRKIRKRQKNKTKNKTRKRQKNKTRKTIHKRKNRT
jgi:surface protein